MDRTPKPGEIYRHFKNKLYQILAVAEHTETGEQLVIYQALYGTFRIYARPLAMFAGEVDREKYPEAPQQYRFEKMERESLMCKENEKSEYPKYPANPASSQKIEEFQSIQELQNPENKSQESAENQMQSQEQSLSSLNPLLLPFVEAEDFDVKLEILSAMDDKIDQEGIDILYEAMDLPKGTGNPQEQLHSLKQYLEMRKKFEGARLR